MTFSDEAMPRKKRHHILQSFYKHIVGTYFSSTVEGSEKGGYSKIVALPYFS